MMDDEYADRVLALLVGTANLRGAPTAPTFYHDWSDLPAVAAALVFERDRLREVVDALRPIAESVVAAGNPDDLPYAEGNLAAWRFVLWQLDGSADMGGETIVLGESELTALKWAMGMPWFKRFADPTTREEATADLCQMPAGPKTVTFTRTAPALIYDDTEFGTAVLVEPGTYAIESIDHDDQLAYLDVPAVADWYVAVHWLDSEATPIAAKPKDSKR